MVRSEKETIKEINFKRDCFAFDLDNKSCGVLGTKNTKAECENCRFYKTKLKFIKDFEKSLKKYQDYILQKGVRSYKYYMKVKNKKSKGE